MVLKRFWYYLVWPLAKINYGMGTGTELRCYCGGAKPPPNDGCDEALSVFTDMFLRILRKLLFKDGPHIA